MFCIACGASIPEGAAFCPACGRAVGGEQPAGKDGARERNRVPAACTSCGSGSLKRVRRGEYLCEHCGHRFYTEANDPGPEEMQARLLELFEEADEYRDRGDHGKALMILIKGLDFAPEDAMLLMKLGMEYWALGMAEKARGYYLESEKRNPHTPIIYGNLGCLYLTQGQPAEARPYCEKAIAMIEENPFSATPRETAVTYGNYALCLGRLGDLDGAEKYLKIAEQKGYSEKSINNIRSELHLKRRRFF